MPDYFGVNLTFDMLTVSEQQHFWDRKCVDLRGTRTPNLRIQAEFSNHLSYQGQTFAVPFFKYWLWRYRYFWSKVNIWNVNCARATAVIFDTRTDVLVKVSKFLKQHTMKQLLQSNYFSNHKNKSATVRTTFCMDSICHRNKNLFTYVYIRVHYFHAKN